MENNMDYIVNGKMIEINSNNAAQERLIVYKNLIEKV